MEIHQNADFRHSLEVQKFSEMDKTSDRKTRSMFLSMTHGGGDASSEETHVGECVHNSCDLKSMMKEIRIADAYNQKRNSKHKHLLHLGGNSPWFTSSPSKNLHRDEPNLKKKNPTNFQNSKKTSSCVEVHSECIECGTRIEQSEDENQVSTMLDEKCNNQYEYDRRHYPQNGCGDSIDPCSSATADMIDKQRNMDYQIEFENVFRTRENPVLSMTCSTEPSVGSKSNRRAHLTKSAPSKGSSSSSKKSSDSGVSLWSRIAGSLHRHPHSARPAKNGNSEMKKPEKNPESPVTTRVMEFVPPTDISSESPKSLSPQLCHKVIKRKLAPPEPAIAVAKLTRKSNFSVTCKGKANWAYSKQARDEIRSKCYNKCHSALRPSNEDCEKWWAQPRDLQVDSQLLRARRKQILTSSDKCCEISPTCKRRPANIIQQKEKLQEIVQEYVEASESEVDIDLSDSEDSNRCFCFRVLKESVVQLFILKPLRRRNE